MNMNEHEITTDALSWPAPADRLVCDNTLFWAWQREPRWRRMLVRLHARLINWRR